MIPVSGIDVINLFLSPIFVNSIFFIKRKRVDPHNKLTVHTAGMFYTLQIHIEYMDLMEDCRMTIAKAIYELIFKDFIFFPLYECTIEFIKDNISVQNKKEKG
jgi:hypothetical protein